jgi:hypothetical protein
MARVVAALIVACSSLAVPAAVAKDFRPGDLRVCGRDRCVPLVEKRLLRTVNGFYWGTGPVPRAPRVRLGAPGFELRFRNGYASGMVATTKLDRFRAYGVICGRFTRGQWYCFPARAALALRKLTAHLRPLRVTPPPRSC